MAINPINWESLSQAEKAALKAAGESNPLAFTSLWFNVSQMDSFKANWHHHYYSHVAERMLSGESQNNIINIPPGGSKTEFWSIHLPVYCMVKYPRVRILNTSYSKDLVNENSARSRDLIKSSEFQECYPMEIGKDKVDDWTIEKNGKRVHQIFSRPSGGQITGVRGGYMTSKDFSGYITADDWDKMDDLFSDTKRKRSHTRLTNTLRSRRADSDTPFAFIQQRGHVEDSTSYLLAGGMGLDIHSHIKIPALINEEYIRSLPKHLQERCRRDVCNHDPVDGYWSYWPAKESMENLLALRDANPYSFTSQYMQEPEKLDGGIFKEENFLTYGDELDVDKKLIADLPTPHDYEYRFITVDTAQKTNEWNDWTVFAEWGVFEGKIYLLELFRKRVEASDLRKQFLDFVNHCHGKSRRGMSVLRVAKIEDKVSGTGLIQEVKAKSPIPIQAIQRNKDKFTRAMDVAPHHAQQKVVLPHGSRWNYEFISESCSFSPDDSHKYDDQTDVMMDALDHAFVTEFRNKGKGIVLPNRR